MVVDSPPAVAVTYSKRQPRRRCSTAWEGKPDMQGRQARVRCPSKGGTIAEGSSAAEGAKGDADGVSGEEGSGLREELSKSRLASEVKEGAAEERGRGQEGKGGSGVEGEGVAAVAATGQGGAVLAEEEAGAGEEQNDDDIMGVRGRVQGEAAIV